MKKWIIFMCVFLVPLFGTCHGDDYVSIQLFNVTNEAVVSNGSDIYTHSEGNPILYRLELSIENDDPVHGMSLGFVFSGDDKLRINWEEQPDGITRGGADNNGFLAVTVEEESRLDPDSGGTGSFDFQGFMVNPVNADGVPNDSLLIGGSRLDNLLEAGPLEHMVNYYFTLELVDMTEGTFAVNPGKVGPAGDFIFVTTTGSTYVPGFSGPLNFNVINDGDGIILGADDATGIPDIYSLSQNYPNPFNPITSVDFSLARMSDVTIMVFNVLGQQVKTLVNGEMSAGQHSVTWEGDDNRGDAVASGIYFYKMVSDEFVKTRKMVLMR